MKYITEITVTGSKDDYTMFGPGPGWEVVRNRDDLPQDFNQGAGDGTLYIYVWFKSGETGEAVADIRFIVGNDRPTPDGFIKVSQDMKQSAGKDSPYMYLCYRKSSYGSRIRRIQGAWAKSQGGAFEQFDNGAVVIDQDIDHSVHDNFIYLGYYFDPDSISANPEVKDVQALFRQDGVQGAYHDYNASGSDNWFASKAGLFSNFDRCWSHFKAVACYAEKFILSYTNVAPGKLRIGHNGYYLITSRLACLYSNQGTGTVAAFETDHPDWYHPCGAQACGRFMAMGIQGDADTCTSSEIAIYDISPAGRFGSISPRIGTIERKDAQGNPIQTNGVAMCKKSGPGGNYIIAAAQGTALTLYELDFDALINRKTVKYTPFYIANFFDENGNPVVDEHGNPIFNGDSNGLALVTEQPTGNIYLFSMEGGPGIDKLYLHQLLDLDSTPKCKLIATKLLQPPCKSDSIQSFLRNGPPPEWPVVESEARKAGYDSYVQLETANLRWGKGIAVSSPDCIAIWATDRNILRDKFSLLSWTFQR